MKGNFRLRREGRFLLHPEFHRVDEGTMPSLKFSTIKRSVLAALKKAQKRHPGKHVYLTAYQILDLLPERLKKQLIEEYGIGGAGSGEYGAPKMVMKTALALQPKVEFAYLETKKKKVTFTVNREPVHPSGEWCGIYRIAPGSERRRQTTPEPEAPEA